MTTERTLKTLSIYAHSRDCNEFLVTDHEGNQFNLTDQTQGYVPRGIGIGGGDVVNLLIDIETGQILNWDAELAKSGILKITEAYNEDTDDSI